MECGIGMFSLGVVSLRECRRGIKSFLHSLCLPLAQALRGMARGKGKFRLPRVERGKKQVARKGYLDSVPNIIKTSIIELLSSRRCRGRPLDGV